MNDTGSLGHRIDFGPDAFYVAFNEGEVPGVTANHVFGFGYDGSQHFTVPGGWSTGRPHARADGSFILRWGLNAHLRSFDSTGVEQWSFFTSGNMTEPVVGPGGVTYTQSAGPPKLQAIDPSGAVQWSVQGAQLGWMNFLGATPWGGSLLDGGRAGFGQPGWIRSYSTSMGALDWSIDLPEEDPGSGSADLVVQSEWAFDPMSSHGFAMVNALVHDIDDAYGYLYSVDLTPASEPVAYCFGDGTGATCPCAAFGNTGEGCANSGVGGATLAASGNASFSNDTLRFQIDGVPGSKPGLILRGDNQVAIPAGDGILCTSGGSQRSHVQITSAGATTYTDFSGMGFGTVSNVGAATNFQFWYRDSSNPCSGNGFNFTNGVSVTYQP